MATYIKIASNTVGAGGAASVTFSSIPSTYTDLILKISSRNNGSTNNFTMKFNGSSASEYRDVGIWGNGSSASSPADPTSGAGIYGLMNQSTYTANSFDNTEIYIPNYSSSNFKPVSIDEVQESNQTGIYMALVAGLWSNTSAINSITLQPLSSNNYVQYSTFTLYGVSNA
jgi:hypothetical protein